MAQQTLITAVAEPPKPPPYSAVEPSAPILQQDSAAQYLVAPQQGMLFVLNSIFVKGWLNANSKSNRVIVKKQISYRFYDFMILSLKGINGGTC